MESLVGFIIFIVTVPIAIFYFVLLHKIFDIYYLGCSGMTPVIVGCFIAGYFTSIILVGIGFWLLILAVIAIVGYIIYAAATGQLKSDSTESKPSEGDSSEATTEANQTNATTPEAEVSDAQNTSVADNTP
jgi:uncharacterized protein (DUF58 family)